MSSRALLLLFVYSAQRSEVKLRIFVVVLDTYFSSAYFCSETCALLQFTTPFINFVKNEGRGYVLRRVLRRAVRYGQQILGAEPGFFSKLVPVVVENFGDYFPELKDQEARIVSVLEDEEAAFNSMLVRGIKYLNELTDDLDAQGGPKEITGSQAFFLYDSMGFPVDLTELMAQEKGFGVDMPGFEAAMANQRARSREATNAKRAAQGLGAKLELTAEPTAWLADNGVPTTDEASK